MSATAKMKQYDEALINFFDEQLVAHADTIYRMAFALTLSLDGALQLVTRTYQSASQNLERIQKAAGDQGALPVLVATLWRCFCELGNERFQEGQSAVTKAMKSLPVEARAALVAVDVAGLAPAEAARAFEWQEADLRQKLAGARRALMMSNLS